MLMDLESLVAKHSLRINGVLHVGAHFGQEFHVYDKLGIKNMMFFEPLSSTFRTLQANVGTRAILVNTALGNMEGEIEMFTETQNSGQSSSILEPDHHVVQYPSIRFTGKEKVKITRLDNFVSESDKYNFINIDVQGYELEVFKGGEIFLKSIDYIMTEVNRASLYKGCAKIEELDKFLGDGGFKRVETNWAGGTWGDAFYIKQSQSKQ